MIEIAKISLIAAMISMLIQEEHSPLTWYCKLIERLPWYLCKPLGGCYMCFTGQVCLWYYLITRWRAYNPVDHLFFVFAGILIAMVYHKIYCWLR